jgi:hypothetical protein
LAYADFGRAVIAADAALLLQRAESPGEAATSEKVEDQEHNVVVAEFDLELHSNRHGPHGVSFFGFAENL